MSVRQLLSSRTSLYAVVITLLLMNLTFVVSPIRAQVGAADVLGTVTDPSGAVVPNAGVTVKNLGTGVERTTTTSANGEYIVNLLPNGSYSMTVKADGFKTVTVPKLSLSTGDRARQDVKLDTGAVSETIEVTGATSALQTDTSTVSSVIENTAVQDLPLPNRNYYAIVQVQPGITVGGQGGTTSQGSSTSGSTMVDRRPNNTIVANGQADSQNNNMINGFDNNEIVYGNTVVRPTVDGIAELNVNSVNAPAEFGRVVGAAVNVVTKSGTNEFHGSGFEYFRSQTTDARNYFDSVAGTKKAPYRQNNFGGSLGGPILKNKTFVFVAAEEDIISKGLTYTDFVPTAYEVANPGDFTDIGGPKLSTEEMVPFILKMFELYPAPNAGQHGDVGYYISSPAYTQHMRDWEVRVDHHLSANDILYGRYADNPANTGFPGSLPEKDGVSPVGANMTQPGTSITNSRDMQLDYAHIFSPRLLMDVKAGYTHYNSQALGPNTNKGIAQAFGVPNAVAKGAIGDDLPLIGGPAFAWSSVGGPNNLPFYNTENTFQYLGSITYTRGAHDIKVGGGIIRRQVTIDATQFNGGFALMGAPTPPYFNADADFLAGYSLLFARATPVYKSYIRTFEWNGYVQDNWRVTNRLTLNLGVRYDVFNALSDAKGHLSNFKTSTLDDGLATDAHNFIVGGTAGTNTDYGAIAPRVGFAYSVTPKTVVRGGFGMTYFPAYASGSNSSSGTFNPTNPPYVFSYTLFGANLGDSSTWINPAPSDLSQWNTDSSVTTLTALTMTQKGQRTFQTNLTAQREIGASTLTAAFVGVYGRNMLRWIDLNKPNMPGAGNPTPTWIYTSDAHNPNGNPRGYLNNVTNINAEVFDAYSNYDALQLIYSRRLVKGLSANANWTLAHGLSSASGVNNDTQDYGNSGNDIRHRITGTATYSLPFKKSLHGFIGEVVKGWQANGIFQWQTGAPFTLISDATCNATYTDDSGQTQILDPRCTTGAAGMYYNNQPGNGINSVVNVSGYRPNIVAPHPYRNGKLNYDAITPPAPGTQGNEAVNSFNQPHFKEVDMSLFKTFQLNEHFGLQFRAEAMNISNTPNFVMNNVTIANWVKGAVTAQNPYGIVAKDDAKLGHITDTAGFSNPREFQFALKLLF